MQAANPFEEITDRLSRIEHCLLDLKNISPNALQKSDQLLNVEEVADLLGLSVPTIYGYVQRAEIPVNKRSKRLYFSREEIVSWIKEGRRKTVDEISQEAQDYLTKKGGSKS